MHARWCTVHWRNERYMRDARLHDVAYMQRTCTVTLHFVHRSSARYKYHLQHGGTVYVPSKCCKSAFTMCPVRAIFLEFTKNALKMRPLRALFFEFTKNSHEMCPHRALSLKFTKSAHKFALFQHHIPCPQKMLDARLQCPNFQMFLNKKPFSDYNVDI